MCLDPHQLISLTCLSPQVFFSSDPFEGGAFFMLSSSYTMGCQPVRGGNPRALARGLSYVQVDNPWFTILYHLHQCRHCTSRDISC